MNESFETLKYEESAGIGRLEIHRPQALNALNAQLLGELERFLKACESSSSLRCLIVTGSGEKAFVAGADIKEIADLDVEGALRFARRGQAVFRQIETLKVPVIAAVNGFALGGGLELALACDFILCHERARFGLPEVSLGIMPGFGGTQRLRQAVGLRRAREMAYAGAHYNAAAAQSMNLVNAVVEVEKLLETAHELATKISAQGPLGVQACKDVLRDGDDQTLPEALELEAQAFAQLFDSADAREGTQAFIEKRQAQFTGR